ncbi:MAG: OsmC family protein [Spirochaetia bacterium]
MIVTHSEASPFLTRFSSDTHMASADTTPEKGGGSAGFRPHELLEAALATCVNMHVRMYASNHGIAVESVSTSVSLDRSNPSEAIFKYSLDISGKLSPEENKKLMKIAESCPVRQTLSRNMVFVS